jgi:tetratricopeptide (TPR) repeat protein
MSGSNYRRRIGNQQAARDDFLAAAEASDLANLPLFAMGAIFFDDAAYLTTRQFAHARRARGLLKAGDVPAAVREAEETMQVVPREVELAIEIITDFDAHQHPAEADALFRKWWSYHRRITADFPRYGQGHNAAAWLAANCGREPEAAIEHATKAVELEPRNTAFIDTLAESYFRAGRRSEAVEQMKKCLELEPKSEFFQSQLKRFSAPATTAPAAQQTRHST